MKKTSAIILAAIMAIVLLASCMGNSVKAGKAGGSSMKMDYATLLHIQKADSFTLVTIDDAWNKGRILHTYILVDKDKPLPAKLPEGTVVRTPLDRVVALSSVHASLLQDLELGHRVVGICDAGYVVRRDLVEKIKQGEMANMGSSMSPVVEKVVAVKPDAILASPFANAGYGAIGKLGVPIIECADYMEKSALGRAEWVKLFGLLFGVEEMADKMFEDTEEHYNALKAKVAKAHPRPTAMSDMKEGAAWYMPGGQSTWSRLFADAGIDYLFAGNDKAGSVAYSFEEVYERAANADLWLLKYGRKKNLTYGDMAREFPSYGLFMPWKKRNIYGCNTLKVPFYEEVPFHPDFLLEDLIRIAYPEVLPEGDTRYYFPLDE